MKRINKVLLALVLTFGLFMVCDLTYADQMGPCTNDTCTLSVDLLAEDEELLINPEFINVAEDEELYAVSITSISSLNRWSGRAVLMFDASYDGLLEYVPVGGIGTVGTNRRDGYFYVSTVQDDVDISSNKKIVGYLKANKGIANVTAAFAPTEYYGDDYDADVTVNGIKSTINTDYIDVNLFFGDFQYNYVLTTGSNVYENWEPVNRNSGKIIIDNTNSIADLNCNLYWDSNVSDIELHSGLSISGGANFELGDRSIVLNKQNSNDNFEAVLGTKTELNFLPNGGNVTSVREILNQGGTLGKLSLRISTGY